MKRMVRITALALFALASGGTATAQQVSINSFGLADNTPVKLVNATDDGKSAVAQFGTAEVFVPAGGNGVVKVRRGIFQTANGTQLTVAAKVCESVRDEVAFPPPDWTRDPAMGPSAITDDYLVSGPRESELRERVRNLKTEIDHRETLGRGEMKRALDRWLDNVRRHGLGAVRPVCISPVEAISLPIFVPHNEWNRQIITLFLRGNKEDGYRIIYQ